MQTNFTSLSALWTAVSNVTSKLQRNKNKKGLYIICLNNSKLLSSEDFTYIKETAKSLGSFLVQDPNNWVNVSPLSEDSITIDNSQLHQNIESIFERIESILPEMTQPLLSLTHFIKGWRNSNQITKLFDVFLVVISPTTFNPDWSFYFQFISKKLKVNAISFVFGNNPILCKEQTFKFNSACDMFNLINLLGTKTGPWECKVELYSDHNSVYIQLITSQKDSEFEFKIFRKNGAKLQLAREPTITNKKELRIDGLEPDTEYILHYQFHTATNSNFFEEVSFHTSSQYLKDVGLIPQEKAKVELDSLRKHLLLLSTTETEKLMGIFFYNILLFGRIGAGKSSLASTMHRAGTGVFDPNFAYVDFSNTSCTKELNKLELMNCSPIKLWDTYGLDDNNYDNNILESVLDGKAKDMFKPGDQFSNKESRLGDSVHALVVVVDVHLFAEEDELHKLRRKVELIKAKNLSKYYVEYYPILVITKLDTLQTKKGAQVSCKNMHQMKQSEDIINRANQIFHIDKNNIFLTINYCGEEAQDVYKELLSLRILNRCIERAKQFINKRKRILIRDTQTGERKIILLTQDEITLAEFRQQYGNQISKLVKTNDFYFSGCTDNEDEVELNQISHINEDLGEYIKSIDIIGERKELKNDQELLMHYTVTDSLNDRVSKSIFTEKQKHFDAIGRSNLSKATRKTSTFMNRQGQENDPLSSNNYFYTDYNDEYTKQEELFYAEPVESQNHTEFSAVKDLQVEDLEESPSKNITIVVNGEVQKELQGINFSASLTSVRKKIREQHPDLDNNCFTFIRKVDGIDMIIPSSYENEVAINLNKVLSSCDDATPKFYIKTFPKNSSL